MLKKMVALFGKKQIELKKKKGYFDIFGHEVPDAEYQFYPPKITGISVFSIETLLDRYQPQIDELRRYVKISDHRKGSDNVTSLFDALYVNTIALFAAYAHMLPASESHHHSQPGGLLVHSLEVALNSMRKASESRPETLGKSDYDSERAPRYIFAAWLVGLLHDTGKILIDMHVYAVRVFDAKQNKSVLAEELGEAIPIWRPERESLIAWAKRYGVDRYAISHVERQHNEHIKSNTALVPHIIKGDALDYILGSPGNLYAEITDTIGGYKRGANRLSSYVKDADSLSTLKDISIVLTSATGGRVKSAQLLVVDQLKALRTQFEVNQRHGHLWIIGDMAFLRWQKGFDKIITSARSAGIKSIPIDPSTLKILMEDSNITEWFYKTQSSISFAHGEFEPGDVLGIQRGEIEVEWEEIIQLSLVDWVYGGHPIPSNAPGVIYISSTNEYFIAFRNGIIKPVKQSEPKKTKKAKPKDIPPEKNTDKPKEPVKKRSDKSAPDTGAPRASSKPEADKAPAMTFLNDGASSLKPSSEASTNNDATDKSKPAAKTEALSESTPDDKPSVQDDSVKLNTKTANTKPKPNKRAGTGTGKAKPDNEMAKAEDSLPRSDNKPIQVEAKKIKPAVLARAYDAKADVVLGSDGRVFISAHEFCDAESKSVNDIGTELKEAGLLKLSKFGAVKPTERVMFGDTEKDAFPIRRGYAWCFDITEEKGETPSKAQTPKSTKRSKATSKAKANTHSQSETSASELDTTLLISLRESQEHTLGYALNRLNGYHSLTDALSFKDGLVGIDLEAIEQISKDNMPENSNLYTEQSLIDAVYAEHADVIDYDTKNALLIYLPLQALNEIKVNYDQQA